MIHDYVYQVMLIMQIYDYLIFVMMVMIYQVSYFLLLVYPPSPSVQFYQFFRFDIDQQIIPSFPLNLEF
jgi:hypothetical protein